MSHWIFPKWVNTIRPVAGGIVLGGPLYLLALLYYGGAPRATDVGYQPKQPVEYSHAMHAGELGMDCRYCHNTVEVAATAAIPPTQTCMNCHATILPDSDLVVPVRQSYGTGTPIPWVRVHDLPDFVFFDHSAHVRRGVGCFSCHDRIDRMEVVYQAHTLSMAWCLDCHRNPEKNLRPLDKVFELDWQPAEDQLTLGRRIREELDLNPSTDCSTCHR